MTTFYRIQPAGLSLAHFSESSNSETRELHVFNTAGNVFHTDGASSLEAVEKYYGGEVVEIEAPESWDNGDVEGVAIDPSQAVITRRWSLRDFSALAAVHLYGEADEDQDDCWKHHRRNTNPADLEVMP